MAVKIPCLGCSGRGVFTLDHPNDPCCRIERCEECNGSGAARCSECDARAVDIWEEQDRQGVIYSYPLCATHLAMFNEDAIADQVRELTC